MSLPKTLLIAIYLSTTISFAQNGAKNFIDQPFIEVTGTIETEIVPNEIYLNIILNEDDKKGKISIESQENQMISILRTLGIDIDTQFSILDFNGYYERKFLSSNEVTKTKKYQLIVDTGECLGRVYEALDKIDISNISITKTSHTDLENIRRQTKLKALKVAKEKANDYANAIDQNIGKALFIQEQNADINNLNGYANGIQVRGYSSNYRDESLKIKIQDLNIKSIIVSATVLTKFALI
ncbi:MAG: SIMPL domain-containing protein [Algibacter sp.]